MRSVLVPSTMTFPLAALVAALIGGGCGEGGMRPEDTRLPDAGHVTTGATEQVDAGVPSALDGGASDGGTGGPDAGSEPSDGGVQPEAACVARPLLEHFGASRFLVGGDFDDAVSATAPFDIRYHYLAGGISAGDGVCGSCEASCAAEPGKTWWGCWQDLTQPPGQYLRRFISKAADQRHLPLITYYQQLDASHASEGAGQVAAMADPTLMSRYYADFRFMLQTLGSGRALLHVEPDLWGYLQRAASDPSSLPVAVSTAAPLGGAGAGAHRGRPVAAQRLRDGNQRRGPVPR